MFDPATEFRRRFLARESLLGTMIKIAAAAPIEIVGDAGFDFVVMDGEHGPFDRQGLDLAILAARSVRMASLVRVAHADAVLAALDQGASGVMVPHVRSADIARDVAAACRYRGGHRGFANTTRAGRYGGKSIADHVAQADASVTAIAMIEDPEALDAIDAIAATEGIDGLFLGRGDLSVALGEYARDSVRVRDMAIRIAESARRAGKVICAMSYSPEDAAWLRSLGVTTLFVSSDHGFIRQGAAKALADYRAV